MFDNLKKAFSNVSTGFSEKDLNEKDIEDVLFELEINLLESDVATEVIDSIKASVEPAAWVCAQSVMIAFANVNVLLGEVVNL